MNRAIFPGTFDPFTIGHESIVRRALTFIDEVIIAIGINERNIVDGYGLTHRTDFVRSTNKIADDHCALGLSKSFENL